ncbi:hypothetical protein [Burkholderia thailandensis]|uniref:hypothetical protein n=2 Tax=Burkholderia thailandensis TaxID=57975 RepID=UPI001427ACB5|nr:hypothetical protein [Burkholderia thailandensis]MBS2131139.1 hypothetical protein [Burkholderia thailandensis]MCS6476085.1 hypothetical protein [Burkholderia thailandensis]MCS6493861.1 hypothetical protein [Burkholderia thailandensis]MCS6504869.1 hypothetical protein [Burkholderia thailandensis]MCS6513034.1 hypothetical protein [Burkholderia thailandensis]
MRVDRSRTAAGARKSPRSRAALPGIPAERAARTQAMRSRGTRRNGIAGLPLFGLTISIAHRAGQWHMAGARFACRCGGPRCAAARHRSTSLDSRDRRLPYPAPTRSPNGADRQIVKRLRIIRDVAAGKRMEQRNFLRKNDAADAAETASKQGRCMNPRHANESFVIRKRCRIDSRIGTRRAPRQIDSPSPARGTPAHPEKRPSPENRLSTVS